MHQAITWTNVDWSPVKSSDIDIRAISQEVPQPSITKIRLKLAYLKLHSNFPGVNELMYPSLLLSIQAPSSSPRSLQYRCFSWGNPRTLPDDTHETCSWEQTTPSSPTREPYLWKGFHPWLGRLHWSRRGLWDTREPLLFATCYYTLG